MSAKNLLLGIGIGAAAALGLRELIVRRGGHESLGHWHPDHIELEPEDSRSESHVPNLSEIQSDWQQPRKSRQPSSAAATRIEQHRGETGRSSTETEAELRRTGTDDTNKVRYTRPTEPPTTSGSRAPFTKDKDRT